MKKTYWAIVETYDYNTDAYVYPLEETFENAIKSAEKYINEVLVGEDRDTSPLLEDLQRKHFAELQNYKWNICETKLAK